ncbi:MAG: hypothetical protein ACI80V_000111 [Rhodothermales bacterium]|jgi:hypothetical protein
MRPLHFALIGLLLACAGDARAQDLVDRFRRARILRVAQESFDREAYYLNPAPAAHLPTRGDTLAAWIASLQPRQAPEAIATPPPPPFEVESLRLYGKLERISFLNLYGQTRWAFMQGRRTAEIDTTRTTDIRARLEARFGGPTLTVAELENVQTRTEEEIIQFEYWMVLNDSIPVMVLDVNGPLERGVVVATDARWREELDAIRYALLGGLFEEPIRAPYVDYFYQAATSTWYATGFDGATFFHRRIDRPNLKLGRPVLSGYVSSDPDR